MKLAWQFIKQILIFSLIVCSFVLLLLLPREMEVTPFAPLQYEANFPFTLELYKETIDDFVTHIKEERGFGETSSGNNLLSEVERFFNRSLKVILPAFLLSMIVGTFLGTVQVYFRAHKRGKIMSFISWVFASIPDFFLFIAIQYMLIIFMRHGLPQFSLFGHNEWYSFIIPLISVMIYPVIHMAKFTVVSMENEMGQDYVRTVFSKGLTKFDAMKHMIWNCFSPIMNQSQMVMLYILSSLPIIERISSYNGAGYQLLVAILGNEDVRALSFMLPFLFLMFLVVLVTQFLRYWLVPKEVVGK
ncbi:oligopeptide transport system permease protein [Piscibacillus halophilus]|mgnify:CR=1 FL=1|uniref:Oligopeptide transport system permease protein n=1 Tax=Piscibacillus halophilus TaxID=571933 RepID=A0A1H9CML1_9BACI|nr:oligopeptide transport system permease protein [Piscibacillus halophilus]